MNALARPGVGSVGTVQLFVVNRFNLVLMILTLYGLLVFRVNRFGSVPVFARILRREGLEAYSRT